MASAEVALQTQNKAASAAVDGGMVRFGSGFHDGGGLKLLELPETVLQNLIGEAGEIDPMCFKGEGADSLVFCTERQTFTVKVADTSNALFLAVPQAGDSLEIQGLTSQYYELVETTPRVEQLAALLDAAVYGGPAEEMDVDAGGLRTTTDDLLELVQASSIELQTALQAQHALEINGNWRKLSEPYSAKMFRMVLTVAVAEDLPLDQLSVKQLTASLAELEVPDFVIRCLLYQYGEPIPSETGEDDGDMFTLIEGKVCQYEAIDLLKLQDHWPLKPFEETWAEKIPDSMSIKREHLEGVGLISDTGAADGEQEISFFPALRLPIDLKLRMEALFAKQPVWSLKDISPYLSGVATEQLTVAKILFKHARGFKDAAGNKMFNKR